jgi:hypothetical protein
MRTLPSTGVKMEMRKTLLMVEALAAMAAGPAKACSDVVWYDLIRTARAERESVARALTPPHTRKTDDMALHRYVEALKRLDNCERERQRGDSD